jgi:membrane-bound lytic murein transglycosylase D
MNRIKTLSLLCFLGGWVLYGCGSAHHEGSIAKPVLAPQPAPVKSGTPEVDKVIAKAREHYFLGERELSLGHLEKAKTEFDASLDTLMQYQAQHEPHPQIEAVIDELENKIFNHEMAALKEGDGFTEHPLEPALIDDLKSISTFPPPDQQTKLEVEQELKSMTNDIPVELNDSVLSFIRIFQNARRKEFAGGLARSGRYLDLMRKILREEGVPEDLVYTALIESSFKSNAYSHARAKGFWQFITGTAKRYDLKMDWWVDERSDFEKSTHAAARYLKDLYGMFGDWYLALAGYNAGENKIVYALRQTGPMNFWDLSRTRYFRQETKNYVPAFLAAMIISKDPQKYGFTEEIEKPLEFEKVPVDYAVDLRLVAECSGLSLEQIKLLNPELNRLTTPSRSTYDIRLPSEAKKTFLTEIATVPESKRITWRKHEVKEGESLTTLAGLYRTSASSIASANSSDPDATLQVGSKLVIPIGREPEVSYSPRSKYAKVSGYKRYYSVHKGDTLFRIAGKNGISVDKLCSLNGISMGHVLRPGESLLVRFTEPKIVYSSTSSGKTKIIYRVKKGDTLFQIASNYNTDIDSIKRWNRLRSSKRINPGDQLTIYTK